MFNNVKYYIYSVLTLHKISCIVQKILQQNINRKYRIIKGVLVCPTSDCSYLPVMTNLV